MGIAERIFLTCPVLITKRIHGVRRLTYPLQMGELSTKVSQQWHQAPVVDGYQQYDSQGVEDCQAGCRYGEASTKHTSIHGSPLLHKEAAHLQDMSFKIKIGDLEFDPMMKILQSAVRKFCPCTHDGFFWLAVTLQPGLQT